jgi:hypothetical protein
LESGPSKKAAGEGFSTVFSRLFWSFGLASSLYGKENSQTASFVASALALSLWVKPSWRIERAVEEHEDGKIIALLRRTEVLDVADQPLLTYSPAPTLTATDERFQASMAELQVGDAGLPVGTFAS